MKYFLNVWRKFNIKFPGLIASSFSRLSSSSNALSISTSELSQRRFNLAALLGRFMTNRTTSRSKHLLIFPSSEVQYMAYHVPYPYHQDSTFLYFTNFDCPNAVFTMSVEVEVTDASADPDLSYTEHLFIEPRDAHTALWNGPLMSAEECAHATGISSVSDLSSFPEYLSYHASNTTFWYTPLIRNERENPPPNRRVFNTFLDFVQKNQKRKNEIQSPSFLVDTLRHIKSSGEIALLRAAAVTTSKCLMRSLASSYPGVNEAALYGQLELESRLQSSCLSYPPVIAGGSRALTIHYLNNDQPILDGELVLVDTGCRRGGYTADVTRTWPVNGCYNEPQLILHGILEEVQLACESFASCDNSLHDVHQLMLRELERHLVNERIIPTSEAAKVIQLICPHSVGHFLGLDVHDTPSISQAKKFQPGVVFPLEPGLYIRPEYKEYGIPEEFLGHGLRLEDDFFISSAGQAVRLDDQLPRSAKDIEALVGKQAALNTSQSDPCLATQR